MKSVPLKFTPEEKTKSASEDPSNPKECSSGVELHLQKVKLKLRLNMMGSIIKPCNLEKLLTV